MIRVLYSLHTGAIRAATSQLNSRLIGRFGLSRLRLRNVLCFLHTELIILKKYISLVNTTFEVELLHDSFGRISIYKSVN